MRKRNVLLLLGVLSAAGCNEQPYRVGVWAGPTGANMAKMVENEVNYKGGVGGRRLHARVVSQRTVSFNELTPEILALSLDSMATDTMVRAMVMRMQDSVTEAAAQRLESLGVPYLITNPVPADYTRTHPHAFLLVPSVEEQAAFLVDQVQAEPAPRRVALFSLREPHAEALADALRQDLQARNIPIVFDTRFSQTDDQYTMLAKAGETTSLRPSAILFIGRTPSLYEVYGTFLNGAPNARVIASDLAETFHLYGNPGQRYTGVRFVRFMDPRSSDSLTVGLRDRLWGWIGRDELNSEAAVTYEAIKGIAEVMNTGATTRDSLSSALRNGARMTGLHGNWQFDAERRVRRPIYLAEVRRDSVVVVANNVEGALARQ